MRTALLLALTSAALAAPVTRETALATAEGWLQHRLSPDQARALAEPLALPDPANATAWLVPLEPAGFVLVAADDLLQPVLGWSADSPVSGSLPLPFEDFLGNAQGVLRSARAAGETGEGARPLWQAVLAGEAPASRELGVNPLLSCTWDQGAGWNALCPADANGPGGRVWAGCVAVSMGQVMHYWQQPRQGEGGHGYTSDYGWLFADFGAATYDWSQISANAPGAEAAELLYHCGVAVDMMYAADGSGAYVGWGQPCARTAMSDHFGYTPNATYETKEGQSWSSWRDVLREELDAGRPVIMAGYGSGGHAFNLDGWRDDNYFHLNWGWSGSYNGWFLIDQLNPGGSNFSEGEGAICGLFPLEYQHAPTPVAPLSGAAGVPCEPLQLQWSTVAGATSYDIQVDMGAEFRQPVVDESGLAMATRSLTSLDHWTTYYWRVRSHGALGTSPWSPTQSFTTAYWSQTPSPVPVTPRDGASGVHLNPTVLVWDFVTGGQLYDVEIASDATFNQVVLDTAALTDHFALWRDRLDPGTTYHWRVRCHGEAGPSQWSETRTFTTESVDVDAGKTRPAQVEFAPAWPNPFNPATTLSFTLPASQRVTLEVYDAAGRRVDTLLDGAPLASGTHRLSWLAQGRPSGMYLFQLKTQEGVLVKKAVLVR